MTSSLALRAQAEQQAALLPPLLARATQLASTVMLGQHGRRRAGQGDDFWQYRAAQPGDPAAMIDWRRSARGDTRFVREREWQIAQSVMFWVDRSASMRFASASDLPQKAERARLLGLALAVLLVRGGERVGLTGTALPPRRGEAQLQNMASLFLDDDSADYGMPEARAMLPHARAVFVSDFLGDMAPVQAALGKAADRGVRGLVIQVLDPSEEAFPFAGRTVFESMGGSLQHETLKASDLRARYLQRLAARKAALQDLCTATGWQFLCHHTNSPAQTALLWAWHGLSQAGGR